MQYCKSSIRVPAFRRAFRRAVGTIGCIAMAALLIATLPSVAQEPQKPDAGPDYARFAEAVDRLEARLSRLRGQVDQTRFDPDELIFELAFDSDEIISFVRDEIAFHPYEGLLRGMRGTLMNRAGNSLDQALLLAYMLKSAGADARIVRGELGPEAVKMLLGRSAAAPEPEDLAELTPVIRDEFGARALETGAAIEWADTRLAARARETASVLTARLETAGIMLPATASLDGALLEALKQYFWVEYRTGPGDPWASVHPAFGEGAPEVEPLEYMADSIDEKYQHRLTFSAWIRQRTGDKVAEHRLMKPWTRPSANLHGVTISWRNHPSGLTPETLANLDEALDDSQIFTPVFNGAPAPGAMAFDLKGRTIDPMALGSGSFGAAGLFAELSNKMESAAGGIDGGPDAGPLLELEAMWIEFVLTSPSGRRITHRRYLLAPGHEGMTPAEKLWPLLSEQVYLVNTARMPPAYLADRFLAAGAESMEIYKALAHKLLAPDEGTPLPESDIPQDFGPMALYRLMAENPLADAGLFAVRHEPSIVGLRNGLRDADTAFSAVDIVHNRMLHLRHDDGGLVQVPTAALHRGVWETGVETVPGKLRGAEPRVALNTFEIFQRAADQDIELRVIKPGDDPGGDGLDRAAAAVIGHDLEAGYAIVLPERMPEGVRMNGWWRVDPASGTTLGMTADGFGQDVVEYLIDVTGIAFNLVQALGGLMKCEELTDNVQKMCCLVEAHINNVAGLGFGSIMGATVGSAGAALFDIVNFGMTEATGAAFGEENARGLMPTLDLSCKKMEGTQW